MAFSLNTPGWMSPWLHLLPDNPYDCEFNGCQWLNRPQGEVFKFFSDETNLHKITPPWLGFEVLGKDTPDMAVGTHIDYKLKIHGFPMRWRTKITDWNPPHSFSDIQLKGPYKKWDHTHRLESLANGTLMTDQIYFRVPMGYVGNMTLGSFVKRDVEKIFSYRQKAIEELFS